MSLIPNESYQNAFKALESIIKSKEIKKKKALSQPITNKLSVQ